MTGTLPRRGRTAPATPDHRPEERRAAPPATPDHRLEGRRAAPPATPDHRLEGRRAAPPATPGRWPEERIARLAEDAARYARGVSAPAATVRADARAARVDLDLAVDHGEHLPTVAEAVRRRVAAEVEAYTGLTVAAVTVTVVDLLLPERHGGTSPGNGG